MCYTNIGTRKNIQFKNIKNTFTRIFFIVNLEYLKRHEIQVTGIILLRTYYVKISLQFCSTHLIKELFKTSLGEFRKFKLSITSTFQNICMFWWQIQVYSKSGLRESAMDWAGVVSVGKGLATETLRLGNSYESWLGNGWTGSLKRGQVSQ